ncbi:S26 family signal peptidase [Fusobacterium polymorphum]|uniref:S26 family signal peptidase n=1 Tax=Fusobacterium nucleatum subsp. polymorphum TaxID=76857 RepID=UPI00300A849C
MENLQKSKRKHLKKIIYYSVLWFLIFLIISFFSFIIFAKKNRYVFNISESLPIGIYQKLEDKNFQKGDLVILDIPKERMDFMISRGYIDGKMLKTMLKRIEGVEGETFKVLTVEELKGSLFSENNEFSSIEISSLPKKFLIKENKILGSISNFDSRGRQLPQIKSPLILNKDEFFVMGESDNSFDSRYFGKIKKEEILYKVKPILTF